MSELATSEPPELTGEQALALVDAALTTDLSLLAWPDARGYAADRVAELEHGRMRPDYVGQGLAAATPELRDTLLSRFAMNVVDDRYGAGSAAAFAVLRVALVAGFAPALALAQQIQDREES